MFFHSFKYKFKAGIRNKEIIFWLLMFPIVLSTLFKFAFSNILKGESFETVNIAVVNNESYMNDENFKQFLEATSKTEDKIFNVSYVSESEAKSLLKDKKVTGYVILNPEILVVVSDEGYKETIVTSVFNEYQKRSFDIQNIISSGKDINMEELVKDVTTNNSYVKSALDENTKSNVNVIYFYSLIGMVCMFSFMLGMQEINATQASLSTLACRNSICPVPKMKSFMAGILAGFCIQLLVLLVFFVYLLFVLKIDFGGNFLYIITTAIIGSICGIFFGTFVYRCF